MKRTFALAMLICLSFVIKAQITLDSIQIERISKISQLWGHIKYFHPYLEKNSENWDLAFTNSIDAIIKATSHNELKNIIHEMLLSLNDPVTCIIESSGNNLTDTIKYPKISYLKDSVLLFSIRDYSDLEDLNFCDDQFSALKDIVTSSHGIIFDLRNNSKLTDNLKGFIEYYFDKTQLFLSNKTLYIPGYKSRFHDGFRPEENFTSGGYASGHYIKDDRYIYPSFIDHAPKIVFLHNQNSELPRVAFALQEIGQGFIISTDSLSDKSLAHTATFEIEDSVSVQIRLDELAIDSKITADYILPDEIEDSKVFEIALKFLHTDTQIISGSEKTIIKKLDKEESSPGNSTIIGYYPDLGNRMLALAKIWTVIDYFFAYKDLMDDNWNEVLKEYIPRFLNAMDSLEYNLAVAEMYSHIQDGHGFIRSKVLSSYYGTASPPLKIRFIEKQPVVVNILPDSIFTVRGIERGDIITKINGENIESIIKNKFQYRSASNNSALYYYISRNLLNGKDSSTLEITIRDKKNKTKTIELPRYNSYTNYINKLSYGGRDSLPIIKLINKDIGYADLDRLTVEMVDEMFEKFKDTKSIIFDMRGYPNGTAWAIAPHLIDKKNVYAANFRRYSPMNMNIGTYKTENLTQFNQPIPDPKLPKYNGITVMLIDERTQSQAEHTGLFFEAANNTKFIGSQTAGANGDVTSFKIPGNITLFFSGHDVRHIDGRQLQKVGLVPYIEVKPTINGIREGKDEVLEKAVEYVTKNINK